MKNSAPPSQQQGLVLVIALIMLVIISLFTVTSIRSAISSESIANNTRMVELATQAADIALRHCEKSAVRVLKDLAGFGDTTVTSACNGNDNYPYQGFDTSLGTTNAVVYRCVKAAVVGGPTTLSAAQTVTTPKQVIWGGTGTEWQNLATWDSSTTKTFVLPLSMVGATTFKRPPECMVESLGGAMPTGAGTGRFTGTFVVTARGFGPEVPAADTNRSRPIGTEVWLQSTIEFD